MERNFFSLLLIFYTKCTSIFISYCFFFLKGHNFRLLLLIRDCSLFFIIYPLLSFNLFLK